MTNMSWLGLVTQNVPNSHDAVLLDDTSVNVSENFEKNERFGNLSKKRASDNSVSSSNVFITPRSRVKNAVE